MWTGFGKKLRSVQVFVQTESPFFCNLPKELSPWMPDHEDGSTLTVLLKAVSNLQ